MATLISRRHAAAVVGVTVRSWTLLVAAGEAPEARSWVLSTALWDCDEVVGFARAHRARSTESSGYRSGVVPQQQRTTVELVSCRSGIGVPEPRRPSADG